jgi:hypothetical protein
MNTGLTYKVGSSVQDDREGPLFGKIIKISGRAECLTEMFKQSDWFGPAGHRRHWRRRFVCRDSSDIRNKECQPL